MGVSEYHIIIMALGNMSIIDESFYDCKYIAIRSQVKAEQQIVYHRKK